MTVPDDLRRAEDELAAVNAEWADALAAGDVDGCRDACERSIRVGRRVAELFEAAIVAHLFGVGS